MNRSRALLVTEAALFVLAVGMTVWAEGLGDGGLWLGLSVFGLFFVAIALGTALRTAHPGSSSSLVDLGGTAALALVLVEGVPHRSVDLPPLWIVAVAGAALALGALVSARCSGARPTQAVWVLPRLVVLAVLAVGLRGPAGQFALEDLPGGGAGHHVAVIGLVLLLLLMLLAEAPLRALVASGSPGLAERVRLELRHTLTLGIVPVSTAVLTAVAFPVLGHVALPLIMLPLVFNQLALARHAELRRHSRHSVEALSVIPETMGLVRQGHAERVAALTVRMGRSLGLSRAEIEVLERAALLHDVGQVRLGPGESVPGGCTISAATVDQERIATAGADIVEATGVLGAEADVIRHQAVPYAHHVSHRRTVPVGSRILKVANALDDLLTGSGGGLPLPDAQAAVDRLYLGLGHEYDPRVVDAAAEMVRAGVSPAALSRPHMAAS